MSTLTRFLYPLPAEHRATIGIIRWWESRRPAYNVAVGATGLVTLGSIWVINAIPPHGMLIPPQFLLGGAAVYGVMANVCYTFGWVIESTLERLFGSRVIPSGSVLFRQGVIFSIGLTVLPTVISIMAWVARCVTWIVRS